jgi:acylphosphatase
MTAVGLFVSGRVQGVGYRDWLVREARRLGVHGWVRNLPDGRVEAVVRGEAAAVEAVIAACRRGPVHARVDDVVVAPVDGVEVVGFERR